MAYLDGQRSVFPGEEDKFSESFDLTLNQLANAHRLNELRAQTTPLSPAQEQEILSLASELRENIITAEDWNKLGDAIINLQKFFNSEVKGYIQNKQTEWNTYVNNFNYRGVWVSGRAYKKQNLVTLPNGNLYIAMIDHTSSTTNQPQAVSNSTWGLIGAKGDKGDPGISATYKGDWISTASYQIGDAVTHISTGVNGGLIYIAKTANTGKAPNASATDWQLYTQIWTSQTAPLGAQAGTHFIRITK